MIITIDTSKDSAEAIRKAIALLNELSGGLSSVSSGSGVSSSNEKYVNIFDDNSGSAIGNSLNNIFGAVEDHKTEAIQSAEKQPSIIMLDDVKKEAPALPDENSDELSDEIIPYD